MVIASLLAFLTSAAVAAQTPVTPPARADLILRGNLLNAVQKSTQADCQTACGANPACSGYSFYVPGYAIEPPKANCTLLSGVLSEAPATGVVSCRMPCAAPISLPGGKLLDPAAVIAPRSPGIKPPAPRPLASVAPLAPVVIGNYTAPSARSGIVGHEVVNGPWVSVPPLSEALVSAQCPAGKVALSAGYEFQAGGDAIYGLEVRGAYPEGDHVRVMLRNANVLVGAQGRALAVCAQAPAGLRSLSLPAQSHGGPVAAACAANERLIGGGLANTYSGFWMAGNGPWLSDQGQMTWQVYRPASGLDAPLAPPGASDDGRALCAAEARVEGWEYRVTPVSELGARAQVVLDQTCSAGKVLLAAGFQQHGVNDLDIVANQLTLRPTGASVRLLNRNLLGSKRVVTALSILCASSQ